VIADGGGPVRSDMEALHGRGSEPPQSKFRYLILEVLRPAVGF